MNACYVCVLLVYDGSVCNRELPQQQRKLFLRRSHRIAACMWPVHTDFENILLAEKFAPALVLGPVRHYLAARQNVAEKGKSPHYSCIIRPPAVYVMISYRFKYSYEGSLTRYQVLLMYWHHTPYRTHTQRARVVKRGGASCGMDEQTRILYYPSVDCCKNSDNNNVFSSAINIRLIEFPAMGCRALSVWRTAVV